MRVPFIGMGAAKEKHAFTRKDSGAVAAAVSPEYGNLALPLPGHPPCDILILLGSIKKEQAIPASL